jgi:hypothetical protein
MGAGHIFPAGMGQNPDRVSESCARQRDWSFEQRTHSLMSEKSSELRNNLPKPALMEVSNFAFDPMIQRVSQSAQVTQVHEFAASNFASEATKVQVEAKTALRMGFAFWGLLSILQAYKFQWGLWGPLNFSGVAITLFFCFLHVHGVVANDSIFAKRFVKPSLALDFLVSVVLALGGLVRFVSNELGEPIAIESFMLFAIALGVCAKLANLLGRLAEPS